MKDEEQEEFGGKISEVFAGNGWAAGAGLLPSTASSFLGILKSWALTEYHQYHHSVAEAAYSPCTQRPRLVFHHCHGRAIIRRPAV